MIHLLASLTWDPGIRGILVVALAVGVLCGTPLILLTTNLGARMGTFIASTALFGWLTLMFFFWAIYGLGYHGPAPSWNVLDTSNTPTMAYNAQMHDVPQPGDVSSAEDIAAKNQTVAKELQGKNYPTLGDVLAADPSVAAQLKPELNGWRVAVSGSPINSDAASSAGEYLLENGYAGMKFNSSSDFVIGNVFERGGKPLRSDDSMMGRVTHRIQTTAMWFAANNPTHYAVVQVYATVPQTALPGEPPPRPVIDPDQPVINVLLVRDLGAVRQPAFAFGTLSLIVFLILCYELHRRDKAGMEARAAAEAQALGA